MPVHAVILEQSGADPAKQHTACLTHAGRAGYEVVGIARSTDDALALVRDGAATVVVAAYASPAVAALATELEAIGAELLVARRPARAAVLDPDAVIVTMARNGLVPRLIAQGLGIPLSVVVRALRAAGIRADPE